MTNADDALRVLAPQCAVRGMSRRGFVGAIGASALAVACGTSADGDNDAKRASSRATNAALEPELNIYTWAEYQNPANETTFTQKFGPRIRIDIADSNEAMLAKLELSEGTAGYDVVVPNSTFVPVMASKGLLMELDRSKLPNLVNLEERFTDLVWDRENKYSVVKNGGTLGFVYDRKVIKGNLQTWGDFFRAAAQKGVSGRVSVLASPPDVIFSVFYRDGMDVRTEKKEDLDHAERVLLTELAPHIKAFDSYPVPGILEGSFVLSSLWNGTARAVVNEDPDRYRWAFGAPKTGLWLDTWAILKGSKHPEAAHAWINFMLQPDVSAKEIAFHGYNTGVKGTRALLPRDAKGLELIYFTDDEARRLVTDEFNSAHERIVDIYNKVKARAGA